MFRLPKTIIFTPEAGEYTIKTGGKCQTLLVMKIDIQSESE